MIQCDPDANFSRKPFHHSIFVGVVRVDTSPQCLDGNLIMVVGQGGLIVKLTTHLLDDC